MKFKNKPAGTARRGARLSFLILTAGAILFFAAAADDRAQQTQAGHATDFTQIEYFEPPNQRQMKSRMSGAEAQPMTGGLLAIKKLKLETFTLDGKPEMVVHAPECIYDQINNVANSPGHLQLQSGDGKLFVEGDGFLWRQTNSFLTISNNVRTVIENATMPTNSGAATPEKKIAP